MFNWFKKQKKKAIYFVALKGVNQEGYQLETVDNPDAIDFVKWVERKVSEQEAKYGGKRVVTNCNIIML